MNPHEVYETERYHSMGDDISMNHHQKRGDQILRNQQLHIVDNSEPSEEYSLKFERN